MSVARLSATAALLAVCAGLGAPAAVADQTEVTVSASAPRLLSVSDLPDKPQFRNLAETRVVKGLRFQDYCWEQPLPKKKTLQRSFYNDGDGRQIWTYAVRLPSGSAARQAAADARACFSKAYFDAQPKPEGLGTVRHISYGKFGTGSELSAGNTQHRDGKEYPDSDKQWAVGRDGRDVTVLVYHIEPGGKPSKDGWVALAKKAVNRLS